jgi:hypothetical protein
MLIFLPFPSLTHYCISTPTPTSKDKTPKFPIMRIASSVFVGVVALYSPSQGEGYSAVVAAHTNEVGLIFAQHEEGYYAPGEDFVSTDGIVAHKEGQQEEEEEEEDIGKVLRLLKKGKSKSSKKKKKTRKPTPPPTTDPPTLSDGELTFPEEIYAGEGRFTVTMDYGNHKTVAAEEFTSRGFGGIFPGKTVIVNPGEVLEIAFRNNLVLQADSTQVTNNTFGIPDTSNLHFHGGHISGEEPSDDIYIHVKPDGGTYEYTSVFPKDHMPGYVQQ